MNGKIYIIKNTINEKVYIGQTIQDVEERFKQHLKLLKVNQKQLIHKAIKKYGKESFYYSILEDNIKTKEKLNEREEFYIKKYNSVTPNGYNLCYGGKQSRKQMLIPECFHQDIIDKYQKGLSSRRISEEYNCNYHTILHILDVNGVKRRDKSSNLPDMSSKIDKDELKSSAR